jgi:TENA/THI-4/PQQC family
MTGQPADVLESLRGELAPVAGGNRLVPLIASGALPRERIAWLAAEEYRIVHSDRRSFIHLAARFPDPPAADFFIGLAQGESLALARLIDLAAALGWSVPDLEAYEPRPGCQAYAHYVAWMALNGTQPDVIVALVANFAAWGGYCQAIADGLRRHYGLADEAVGFFDMFATPAPAFEEQTRAVVRSSVGPDGPSESARRMARALQACELSFWNTLAEGAG